ncbi:MAG: hypothetical protein AB1488_08105 [Nitrospirota bacterium]
MDIKDLKINGLCIGRLKHQISIARARIEREGLNGHGIVLESYNTGDIDDIIDILELYDIEDRNHETLVEKLKELAEDASLFVDETLEFGFNDEGHLCLYFKLS